MKPLLNNIISQPNIYGRVNQHELYFRGDIPPTFGNVQITGDTTIEGNLYVEGNTTILETNLSLFFIESTMKWL